MRRGVEKKLIGNTERVHRLKGGLNLRVRIELLCSSSGSDYLNSCSLFKLHPATNLGQCRSLFIVSDLLLSSPPQYVSLHGRL